ncbi:MAG: DUF3800 domain-containing protein [Chitinophagaceae bacterium]|nr:DUF3800 domain-containing protein [Anaerolineae bacterium]
MTFTHVVYVDEAGDEGFGKLRLPEKGGQSQWLLLGSMIVRGGDDTKLPKWRNSILARFPRSRRRDLHFRDLNHEQKVVVCQEIANLPMLSCITFSNKLTIPGSQWANTFKRPGYLYNYLTRWLLERVTSYCAADSNSTRDLPCRVKLVFSRRRGTDYQSMAEYLCLMRDGREAIRPARNINWNVFDPADIAVENHKVRAGLQFSDAFTSAFFAAVEPNFYGNVETRYAEILRNSVVRVRGNALNAGITPVPSLTACRCEETQAAFFRSFIR